MQDRYAGDVGDFLSFALLRRLVEPASDGPGLALGVIWYRVPDESHNADGKHVAYLDPNSASGRRLRPLDPDLYDRLRAIVESGRRSVPALVDADVVPGACHFVDVLTLADLAPSDRAGRIERRRAWLQAAHAAVAGTDVVFLDPDNGLRRDDHPTPAHRNRSEKHAYLSEISPLLSAGQSVIAYQHADRSGPVHVQAQRRMRDLYDQLGVEPAASVRFSRGSTRLFLLIPAPRHREHFDRRLALLDRAPWSDEFVVYRPPTT